MSEIMLAISYQEQLAAKDAEISELRARASNAELQRDVLQQQSAAFLAERDEARECVRRLYKFVRFLHKIYPDPIKGGCASVIAATPEHLR